MTETLTFIIYLICPSEIYKWVAGPWKACSSLCDGGIRYRDVDCYAVFEVTMVPDYPVYDHKCSKEEKVGGKIPKIKREKYLRIICSWNLFCWRKLSIFANVSQETFIKSHISTKMKKTQRKEKLRFSINAPVYFKNDIYSIVLIPEELQLHPCNSYI